MAKKCKECKQPFKQERPLQYLCSPLCAAKYVRTLEQKKEGKRLKLQKESLLTHSDYLKMLQQVFNSYVRKRDEDKGCITCGTSLKGRKFDAGHFFSVGAYPNIRFDEDNCHGQCVPCNQHKHGNQGEYFIQLPKRIGMDRFNDLLAKRNTPLKISIEEIKELILIYKLKIKKQ
jgi:hypothetical protein